MSLINKVPDSRPLVRICHLNKGLLPLESHLGLDLMMQVVTTMSYQELLALQKPFSTLEASRTGRKWLHSQWKLVQNELGSVRVTEQEMFGALKFKASNSFKVFLGQIIIANSDSLEINVFHFLNQLFNIIKEDHRLSTELRMAVESRLMGMRPTYKKMEGVWSLMEGLDFSETVSIGLDKIQIELMEADLVSSNSKLRVSIDKVSDVFKWHSIVTGGVSDDVCPYTAYDLGESMLIYFKQYKAYAVYRKG